jgi:hypothetical protein
MNTDKFNFNILYPKSFGILNHIVFWHVMSVETYTDPFFENTYTYLILVNIT